MSAKCGGNCLFIAREPSGFGWRQLIQTGLISVSQKTFARYVSDLGMVAR